MESIKYSLNPINSLKALSRALGVDEDEILRVSQATVYKEIPLKKKDGTLRITYDAEPSLKAVQKKITRNIFHKLKFPDYIHGCIRDREEPRNIYSNALPHAGKKNIILCDIKDFFPSIKPQTVYSIFRGFLGFSPSISSILTRICTYNGFLPQGASTSSYLANLAFWDIEPALVESINELGCAYTRFADDITISTDNNLTKERKTEIISKVRQAIQKKGCSLKKRKTMVLKRGQSIKGKDNETNTPTNHSITVTSLLVHHETLKISKNERRRVRACVHKLERTDMSDISPKEWKRRYSSVIGKVSRLVSCGHKEGETLKKRLRELKNKHQKLQQRSSNVSGRR